MANYNALLNVKSPEEYAAERQQLKASELTNALNSQKVDAYKQEQQRASQLRNLLSGGADSSVLRSGGFLTEAADMDKSAAEVGLKKSQASKYEADATEQKLKTAQAQLSAIYNAASGARDQQSYSMALEGLRNSGVDISTIPPQFDPAYVENAKTQALTQLQRLEDMRKQQDFGLRKDQFGEAQRHNKASEAATIRGQNLTDARSREGNVLKAAEIQAGGKPPPGYRWRGDGTLEAIPGGPGDKLPEAQQKQVVGTQNLRSAISEYRAALSDFGALDALNPAKRATMGTKYNNMMLQAKEAYNLGVLNGPDFEILQSVITDPRSAKGVITPKSALDTQASELDRIMGGVAETSSQLKPRGAGQSAPKAKSLSGQDRQALDWANANPNDPRAAKIRQKLGM
jgi:hypothetical protein